MATKEEVLVDLTLEACLNTATNPINNEEDWESISRFCAQINKELEGPHYAVRLLAHKIQSPIEREALYALSTVEACVKQCGKRFHQEIGKFRFLNEMIKVISPKYLGSKTTEKVKKRCIELLYCWNKGLKHESKISDAYQMLKQQGIVKVDPTYLDSQTDDLHDQEAEEERKASFEDEEKSKLLAKLLKSKNPDDLQAANRLIKNMVKQDTEKMEKVSRRINELETIKANVKLLSEMVAQYNSNTSTQSEKEMMKELYESLEKLRPKLFRLASDTEEADTDGLNTILKANDEVSHIMTLYKKTVEGVQQNGQNSQTGGKTTLLDLTFDQFTSFPGTQLPVSTTTTQNAPVTQIGAGSLLDDEMLSLGLRPGSTSTAPTNDVNQDQSLLSDLDDIFSSATSTSTQNSTQSFPVNQSIQQPGVAFNPMGTAVTSNYGFNQPMGQAGLNSNQPMGALGQPMNQPMMNNFASSFSPSPFTNTANQGSTLQQQSQPLSSTQTKAMDDLNIMGQTLMQQTLTDVTANYAFNQGPKLPPAKVTLNQLVSGQTPVQTGTPVSLPVIQPLSPPPVAMVTHPPPVSSVSGSSTTTVSSPASKGTDIQPLTDVFVALESIQPGTEQPVTAYDKNGIKAIMIVAKDRPRDDIVVMVISVLSTNTAPVKAFVFQAAVPKVMKVKLQPPSATDLPAFNPILPPSAITQVMLLANPHKEKIRLKYKISYNMNDKTFTDVGDIDSFTIQ